MWTVVMKFIRAQQGTAAIEFAILVPVFLLMLTGMMAYGIYFGAANSVQQIAADAARTAIAGLNETERNRLVRDFLDNNAEDYMFIERGLLSVSTGTNPADPNQYRVAISYDASQLPIWNLYVPLPLPSPVIAYTSTIRRGGI